MEKAEFTVSTALCSICEKCLNLNKIDPNENEESYARALQKNIKQQIHGEGLRSEYRFTVSSCLGLCPAGLCTVLVANVQKKPELVTFKPTMNLAEDTQLFLSGVKSIANEK